MLFNSLSFALFLPIVFVLYWFVFQKSTRSQNLLLLLASYFFYACWDWRFLFLLIFSTFLDYYTGLKIADARGIPRKQVWLWISIGINLGFLGFFKYYNFFAASFADVLSGVGIHTSPWTLQVILPIGISFYTFHGLSYVIDIYKERITPERNFVNYSVFVSFFPLLVAGPIERATHLLPQIQCERRFNYTQAVDGLRQIIWGLFKKIVIADQCAVYANQVFNNYGSHSGSDLVLGAIYFSFQIYGDFSGYSDVALGTARLFGIELIRNFAYPYFSRDIAEFWRRWHISLSSWFRDYLYIPLGGSKVSRFKQVRNTFIIFLVSGFWHGANWTFIAWGLLNALYILPSVLFKTNRNNLDIVAKDKALPSLKEVGLMGLTFSLTVFAWIFFRSANLTQAFGYVEGIFSSSLLSKPTVISVNLWLILLLFIGIEWWGRQQPYAIASVGLRMPRLARWSFYYLLVFCVFYYYGSEQQFIYFQF